MATTTSGTDRNIAAVNRLLRALRMPELTPDVTAATLADRLEVMADVLEGLGETDAALKMSNAGRQGNGTKPRSAVVREFALNRGIPLEQADKLVP